MRGRSKIPAKFDRTNFAYKVRDIQAGHVVPVVKTCDWCKKRPVKYHHFLCQSCWDKKYGKK